MQRAIPSAPDWTGTYTISVIRPAPPDLVLFEVVTDALQRLTVSMRSHDTSAENIDRTIRAALAGLYRKPDPVR